MEDVCRDAFDTPTVDPSDVGEGKQSVGQVHTGESLMHDERQGGDSGCSVDVTMEMEDGNRVGLYMPTVFPLDVGEAKQSFAQPREMLKHYERKQRERASSVDAMMDMENENHAVFNARTVVPLDVGEGTQSLTQGEIFKNDNQTESENCSEDVKIHMEHSEPEEEDNSSLNLDMDDTQLVEYSLTVDSEDENYLSNKHPFFNVIITKSHVKRPYEMNIPDNFLPKLPQVTVPVVLRCGGRNWNISCIRNGEKRMFCSRWGKFVKSNNLKTGDACVFELREFRETVMKFKVILLRNDLPPELQGQMESVGTEEIPIELE